MSYHRTTRARSTGLPVTVAHGADLGLDTSVEGGGPWYTVCDEHGTLYSHQTLALARAWAAEPETWCEVCQDAADEDAYQAAWTVAPIEVPEDTWLPRADEV